MAPLLRAAGYTLVMPEVGELVTSLDMSGVSLTVTWLDDELEPLWTAPAETPPTGAGMPPSAPARRTNRRRPWTRQRRRRSPRRTHHETMRCGCVAALAAAREALHDAEKSLGDLDAIAGDGDHGRGMVRGIDAACTAAEETVSRGAGAGAVLAAAGDAWADKAGGTSGVLWGAGLRAFGESLGNDAGANCTRTRGSCGVLCRPDQRLGKAEVGDKTMVDALVPFTETFRRLAAEGAAADAGWAEAAREAAAAAQATAALRPLKGRARPLAEKSVGTPDPGPRPWP